MEIIQSHFWNFCFNDGGRSKYFKSFTSDCVTRAIATATGMDYLQVFNEMTRIKRAQTDLRNMEFKKVHGFYVRPYPSRETAHSGVATKDNKFLWAWLDHLGWEFVQCKSMMLYTSGLPKEVNSKRQRVFEKYLTPIDIPSRGTYIVWIQNHYTCVIDGVLHDTWDCSINTQGNIQGIYGYWQKKAPAI